MNYIDAVKTCLTVKYCDFTGRASRSEYWWFSLFTFIVLFVMVLFAQLGQLAQVIGGLVDLGLLLPHLGVFVRRLHDYNKSGWFYFLILIPIIGPLILLYWLVMPGTPGPNQYGNES